MTGFVSSESVSYAVLNHSPPMATGWRRTGGAQLLVSSSFVAYFAAYLHKGNLWGFRAVWLLTMAILFRLRPIRRMVGISFSLSSGVFGGMFYLLTGFHGLHVITGVLLI